MKEYQADALTSVEILVLLLAKVFEKEGRDRFERGASLARILHEASERSPLFSGFYWNPSYGSSKGLDQALTTLDLTGLIVGDNMPTRYFRLTKQARGVYLERLRARLNEIDQREIATVAEKFCVGELVGPILPSVSQ